MHRVLADLTACVLSGPTACSWAGILDVFAHPISLAEKQWDWSKWRKHWEAADVLVLDEASMVDCDLIEEVGGQHTRVD
jgi:hypothetical protein